MSIVVGDPTGTSLWYFFGDPAETAGFLSLGDDEGAHSAQADSPLVASLFGDHTEFPRYSVIPHSLGEQALHEFIDDPTEPPRSVTWIPL